MSQAMTRRKNAKLRLVKRSSLFLQEHQWWRKPFKGLTLWVFGRYDYRHDIVMVVSDSLVQVIV